MHLHHLVPGFTLIYPVVNFAVITASSTQQSLLLINNPPTLCLAVDVAAAPSAGARQLARKSPDFSFYLWIDFPWKLADLGPKQHHNC